MVANILIEKMMGHLAVEKLQIIHLFEADFNSNNKWLGWSMMVQAEVLHLLADEQYGRCKYRPAISQCLNKRLWYDLIISTRVPAALCSNNAKSCYNQIVLLVAALCLCCLGHLRWLFLA